MSHVEVRTKSLMRARIYATDGGSSHPIHGAVLIEGDTNIWQPTQWAASGESSLDKRCRGPFSLQPATAATLLGQNLTAARLRRKSSRENREGFLQ